jgi:hypothetical protein
LRQSISKLVHKRIADQKKGVGTKIIESTDGSKTQNWLRLSQRIAVKIEILNFISTIFNQIKNLQFFKFNTGLEV